ncbi:hypothetical protein AUTU_06160 [Aureibacter tunicatorum]|nr:hypothetical protein AUTU_06160 [Aureibacter tunicatorum]
MIMALLLVNVATAQDAVDNNSLPDEEEVLNLDSLVTLTGVVINEENEAPMPFVHVVNMSRKRGVVTDDDGLFKLYMNPGDTVVFSFVGFKDFEFHLDSAEKGSTYAATIGLSPSAYELKAITVYEYPTLDEMKKQLVEMRTKDPEEDKVKIPGGYYGPQKEVKAKAWNSPVSAVAGLFSKDRKMQKRLVQSKKSYEDYKIINSKFSEQVVADITGYSDPNEIARFMQFCGFSNDYLLSTPAYDVIVAIQDKQKIFER